MASFEGGPSMKHCHLRRSIVQRLLPTKGTHSLGGIQCVILGLTAQPSCASWCNASLVRLGSPMTIYLLSIPSHCQLPIDHRQSRIVITSSTEWKVINPFKLIDSYFQVQGYKSSTVLSSSHTLVSSCNTPFHSLPMTIHIYGQFLGAYRVKLSLYLQQSQQS